MTPSLSSGTLSLPSLSRKRLRCFFSRQQQRHRRRSSRRRGQSFLCQACQGCGCQVVNHSRPQGVGGNAFAHQHTGAGLQMFEVEAVGSGMPGRVPDRLYLCHSAALWRRRAAGEAGRGYSRLRKESKLSICTPSVLSMERVHPQTPLRSHIPFKVHKLFKEVQKYFFPFLNLH